MAARMACDYPTLAALLGPLLVETQVHADGARSDERPLGLLVQTCVVASLTLKPLGYFDLALRLAERAQVVARQLNDPVHIAAADFTRAQGQLAQGFGSLRSRSLALASQAADKLQGERSDDARTWYGMLRLHAAMSAATLGRADEAAAHFGEAAAPGASTSSRSPASR